MRADQASATAKVIAASTLLLASKPGTAGLVAPGAAELCLRLLSTRMGDRWLAASARSPWTRELWRALERCTHPGIIEHYWRRKAWIETRTRQALATQGARLIVLGAGFDTLGLRLCAEHPRYEVLELDHPATQAAKRRALRGLAQGLPEFIALDLAMDNLPATLLSSSRRSLVVAEGLLMYLPATALDRLFAQLRRMPCELIFSFMSRWPDGSGGFRPRSRLIDAWLRWRGEPFTWTIEPTALPAYLAERGFVLDELALCREFGSPGSMLDGEHLVRCRPAAHLT